MYRRRRENPETPQNTGKARKNGRRRGIAGTVFFVLGTLMLIGICTAAMLGGIFMKYVNTTLAPALEIHAEDYTMKLKEQAEKKAERERAAAEKKAKAEAKAAEKSAE